MADRRLVGIIGGIGPGGTAAFYQKVVRRYARHRGGDLPPLLIHSVPMEAQVEHAVLGGATAGPEMERLLGWLEASIRILAAGGATAIAMPCNTLQAFVPELVAQAGLPYIPLIQETVAHMRRQNHRRAALICTTPMRALGLYQNELQAQGVDCVEPTEAEQGDITRVILDTLHHAPDPNARLRPIVRRLEAEADAILLGCTDLTAFDDPHFTRLPVVDALDVLADATVDFILAG